ncbi:class I SAM-dependent methyltransferase [Nonomuraea sp. NPDC050328]|uniref:class I SAM-dependent methyltransferase n=1 Tax=Nonomuraea sp. NPDC050328 TaxID=3364361 RepID=UPI0037BBB357
MRQRSGVFGEAVGEYESARAGYPPELVADVLAMAPAGPVLEVGAGTGKASVAFAARGVDLTCVEPDPRMARQLAGHCPGARIEVTSFEDYLPDRAYALVFSAQAWHWVAPERRSELALAALAPGGVLALFWNRYILADPELRERLKEIDDRFGIASSLHHAPEDFLGDPLLAGEAGFRDAAHRLYRREERYPAARYLDLIRSVSAYRMLESGELEELLGLVAAEIGSGVDLVLVTQLDVARKEEA